jgi:histidinol dehydrogenase
LPVERLSAASAADAGDVAARIRALVPGGGHVAEGVAALVADVRTRGDAALLEHTGRFDRVGGAELLPLVVPAAELDAAVAGLDPALRSALELAIENVGLVAAATVHEDRDVVLPQGQRVRVREVPVRRAAVYVPGGRAPYPSTAIMGVVAARAAGVDEVVVASPSDDPVLRAACRLAGADRVYRFGGAHGVAALALGTETVPRVDVVVGPGNLWVQEAKRQLAGEVGIDGFAGPSDLLVLADGSAEPRLVALDLAAQAEHGDGSLVVLVTESAALQDAVWAHLEPGVGGSAPLEETGAAYAGVLVPDPETGLAVADAFAAEHLELVGPTIEPLAPLVRSAGCVFVGAAGATAFGDYVAGSNHTLPTDGAARYASTLSARSFRRTMNEVHLDGADPGLADAGIRIADAEGFVVHAASMRARQNGATR